VTTVSSVEQHCKTALRIQSKSISSESLDRRIRNAFGFGSNTLTLIWNIMVSEEKLPVDCLCKHLLWALSYVKSYNTYDMYLTLYSVSKNTFCTWVWKVLDALSSLENVVSSVSSVIVLYRSTNHVLVPGYSVLYGTLAGSVI
jgi:hypothetical protein